MVFVIPEGLHEDVMPLAWLVGTWRGKGRGEYPGTSAFEFAQEVTFNHDGRDFLNYYSRSWVIDADGEILRPGPSETGFWRTRPNKVLEVVISHSSFNTEGWVGVYDGPKIQLRVDQGYASPLAKPVGEGSRLYGLVEGELFFAYDMAFGDTEIRAHIWSSLERQSAE